MPGNIQLCGKNYEGKGIKHLAKSLKDRSVLRRDGSVNQKE